jgi:Golgi SNAP receptor complex protein 1
VQLSALRRRTSTATRHAATFALCSVRLAQADERSQLLTSVRRDISDHRSSSARETDALLRERNAIHGSSRIADDVISQAEHIA